MPEEAGADWEEAATAEPAKPSDHVLPPDPDFQREWAHVEKIASLKTAISALKAADAIAMDVLAAARRSLPAICVRLAEEAAVPLGFQHGADPGARPDTAQRLRKSLMQVDQGTASQCCHVHHQSKAGVLEGATRASLPMLAAASDIEQICLTK